MIETKSGSCEGWSDRATPLRDPLRDLAALPNEEGSFCFRNPSNENETILA
jgi:hypothetical protein